MERAEALRRVRALVGTDLRPLAARFGVTVWKNGRKNKGWAGHVLEQYLGLPVNSSRAPDFGSWELKVIPVRILAGGIVKVKETMAITMIDPVDVLAKEFEESHLYSKLRKIIVVSRTFVNIQESSSPVHAAVQFDLEDPALYAAIKSDYDLVRRIIRTKGHAELTGKMGYCVQPRTKGPGHGSISRAFYARTCLVEHICGGARLDLSAYG
ncbi:MAG: MvaI/BcnI family restriction endonuclease [Chromatiales bacterium]